jgi:hypothetical protein
LQAVALRDDAERSMRLHMLVADQLASAGARMQSAQFERIARLALKRPWDDAGGGGSAASFPALAEEARRLPPLPRLLRGWARPCHLCAATGPAPCHICLPRDWAQPCRRCGRTGLAPPPTKSQRASADMGVSYL